jgi:hypothetical protein
MFCIPQNGFAQDSIAVPKPEKPAFQAVPMTATMLAVAFPGLGQIYNRKYWKIPFVYVGFGGLIYSVGFNSSNYNKYMKAYQDFTDDIKETTSYLDVIPDDIDQSTYDPVWYPSEYNPATASNLEDAMLRRIDYYRKYRDLSYIGIAAWYLISILDANVDASLYNFDISDNLDIALFPGPVYLPGGYFGAGLNMSLTINF